MIKSTVAVYNSFLPLQASEDGASTYFPDYELVVILATEGRQVLLVVGERQTLDQHLVHLESVHHLERVEVPDDDISLNTRASKLP